MTRSVDSRVSLSALAYVLTLTLALGACGGAANQDLFEQTAEANETSAASPAPTAPARPGTDTPGAPPAATPADDRAEPGACTLEQEPNDDPTKATAFQTALCGQLGAASDIDFGRFVVPVKATRIAVDHSEDGGKVSYRFFLGTIELPMRDDDTLPAVPGATYTAEIRAGSNKDKARPSYELRITAE